MDHVVMLYGYIRDKDIFERDYQIYLADRLLQDVSLTEQAERSMIGLIHQLLFCHESALRPDAEDTDII